jgi:hypothetical protein
LEAQVVTGGRFGRTMGSVQLDILSSLKQSYHR